MSIKQNIDLGKYLPVMPYADEWPFMALSNNDYKHLAIAKVDVYPPGYDPFSEDSKNKPKVKPTQEYYLDILTTTGSVKIRINVADRAQAEDLLAREVDRIKEQFRADLVDEYPMVDKHVTLFDFAWQERLKGLDAVVDRYDELSPLAL